MNSVNEGSACFLLISFIDQSSTPVTPSAGRYRLDKGGLPVRGWTPFTPSGNTHTIEITGVENSVFSTSAFEVMRVTVEWMYDMDKMGTADFTYNIIQLVKYP